MTDTAHVVVTVHRSGGFAGVGRDWTADSAQLGTDQAGELRELVVAAVAAVAAAVQGLGDDLDSLVEGGVADAEAVPELVRDGFGYLVEAQVGRRRHHWRGPTADVPAVRRLAEHVRRVAFDG